MSENTSKAQKTKPEEQEMLCKDEDFKPITVRGLGKTLGFQPKMHRLRVIHNFLWYVIYGHPLQHNTESDQFSETSPAPSSSDQAATGSDAQSSGNTDRQTQSPEDGASSSANTQTADSGEGGEELKDKSSAVFQPSMKVYSEEESWKKFVPPVRIHKEFGSGWAMVGDLLLCLPLSVFIQLIQINYEVDELEEYLNDPVKQHYLVRVLPARMKRQLLYKRKYIFIFHENLQRLVYMGLLQLGPVERFKEKDQVFVHLRRKATIVDTTNAEPHYWQVTESPDKPFERRQYTFSTAEDVENYWFDMMCVCLNTPLGVIRNKRNVTDEETTPCFVHERNEFALLAYLLRGSREVTDDGSIPGDGKGAGGLDSEFFAHLKRNWLWTNHLLAVKTKPSGTEAKETKNRLKSLLSKNSLRLALKAGGSAFPRSLTAKRSLVRQENIEVAIEPASRNQQVVGGKRQKRKRTKKEVVKAPRKKKKEPKKRMPAHDEVDHQALKMMTRQRVYWSVQEDSLMMLCSVASQLLNSKLKRPFIPYCVVRDLLHAEFAISADKTSVAVGRRTRYILKNPQTLLNYRICLAEVYQDKNMLKLLEKNKPADPDKPEDCAKAFSEYTRLLRLKFCSVMNPSDLIMSDTKQQLFSRFKVCTIDNKKQMPTKDILTCTDDIHAIVLHNVIQSTLAMTNSQMKTSRSFQTFHMYSKYNQELLCQVFIQCRKRGLVNRRRVNQPFGPKKNRSLPILPMSYQLSQTYYRCFSWRFPHSLCTDSFCFLRTLLNNSSETSTETNRPAVTFFHETENRTAEGKVVLEKKKRSECKEKESEKKKDNGAVAQPEKGSGDSAQKGDDSQSKVGTDVELQSNLEKTPPTAGSAGDSSTSAASNTEPPGSSEEFLDMSNMMAFSMDSQGGACAVSLSLMTLGMLSVHLSIPKQMVVVDSNLVDNDVVKSMAALEEDDDDDDDADECDGKKRLEVKAHQASHTNYLMMRGYCFPGIVKIRNLNTSDNIVVESCIIKLQLRNTPAHHVFNVENSPPLDLSKCGPSLLPPALGHCVRSSSSFPPSAEECDRHLVEQRGYSPQDIEACAWLRRSLDKAGEKGLDAHDLYEVLGHLEELRSGCSRGLQQYVEDLQEEGQVLKVGSLSVRWVLMKHADPWLLTVNSKQWSQTRITTGKLPFLDNEHNIPFMRKRCRRQGEDEPPPKKQAVDRNEDKHVQAVGESSSNTGEELNEQEQLEKQNEGQDNESGDKLLNVEKKQGKQTQPEEEDGVEKAQQMEIVTEAKTNPREREKSLDNEEVGSPTTGQADLNKEESLSFISRPWRMVDGKLNRQVCKGMLEAILYHVMSRPGLTQQTLVEHYKDVLQPMAVLDLVQALIDMGCVTKKTLVKRPKPSLFTRSRQEKSQTDVKTEEPDAVFYEPTISCCLKLSQVLPNERSWNYSLP